MLEACHGAGSDCEAARDGIIIITTTAAVRTQIFSDIAGISAVSRVPRTALRPAHWTRCVM
jgi:hypothetical protein